MNWILLHVSVLDLIYLNYSVHMHIIMNLYTYLAGTMEPIPVSQFKAHVLKMHSNDDYLFSEEYAVSCVLRKYCDNVVWLPEACNYSPEVTFHYLCTVTELYLVYSW